MQLYVPTTERPQFGTVVGVGAAFFPPGVSIPGAEGLDVFEGLMQQLKPMGVYTPWATRMGSMDWEVVSQPPDTNVVAGKIDDSLYQKILGIGFGAPLPFIGVYTTKLPTQSQIEDAFVGTPYSFYETQAVYNQQDTGEPPKIAFLHWLQLRQPTDSNNGTSSLSAAAHKISGQLLALMQMGYTDTKSREIPADSFETAFASQFALPGSGPVVTDIDTELEEESSKPSTGYQFAVAAAIAVACGVGGYLTYRAVTDPKPVRRVVRRSSNRAIVKRRG